MAAYYLLVGGKQVGPLSADEVHSMVTSGGAALETPAWKEGLAEWSTVQALGLDKVKLSLRKPDPVPEPVAAIQEEEPEPVARRESRPKAPWGQRLKGLMAAILFLPIAAGIFVYGIKLPTLYQLASSGKQATATIAAYEPSTYTRKGTTTTTHWHRIEYDGHAEKLDLNTRREIGSTISVLYLPSDPSVVSIGEQGDGFMTLVDRNSGKGLFFGVGAIGLMFVGLGLLGLWGFVTGRMARPAE